MARPSKLDERLIQEFVHHVRLGTEIDTCCTLAGIGRETFYRWKRRVAAGKGDNLQRKLFSELELAIADYEALLQRLILKAGEKQWYALAWLAERRFPKKYGRKRPYADDPDGSQQRVVGARFSLFGQPAWDTPTRQPDPGSSTTDGLTATDRTPASDDSTSSGPGTRG